MSKVSVVGGLYEKLLDQSSRLPFKEDLVKFYAPCVCSDTLRYYPELDWHLHEDVITAWCLGYVFVVLSLKALIDQGIISTVSKQNSALKVFMHIYNASQVIICSYICWGLRHSVLPENHYGVPPPGVEMVYNPEMEFAGFIYYCTKILDFTDTILFLIRGNMRQFTFLHVFHHGTMPLIAGRYLICQWYLGGAAWGALLNSFVHVLLYFHYFVTGLGYKNPLRKLLTAFQLTQFFFLFTRSCYAIITYPILRIPATIDAFYQSLMFILFQAFYNKTYKKKEKEKMDKKIA